MIKKIIIYILLAAGAVFIWPTTSFAGSNTNLQIRILPLECQFDIINIGGVFQYIYHNPVECGIEVVDPDSPGGSGGISSPNNPFINNSTNSLSGTTVLRRGVRPSRTNFIVSPGNGSLIGVDENTTLPDGAAGGIDLCYDYDLQQQGAIMPTKNQDIALLSGLFLCGVGSSSVVLRKRRKRKKS